MSEIAAWESADQTAVTEGIKFLFAQASAWLEKRRNSGGAGESAAIEGPADSSLPNELYARDIAHLHSQLKDYLNHHDSSTGHDTQLATRAIELRHLLELASGQHLTFAWEATRPKSGTPLSGDVQRRTVSAKGERSAAVGQNSGIISTGDHAHLT